MDLIFTPAYAQTAGGGGFDPIGFFVPLIGIFAIMYFLIIRPQQKRLREHREMVENLRRGDEVMTAGGILGKIVRVNDGEVEAEIAPGVKVRVIKETITAVTSKTEPAKPAGGKSGKTAGGKQIKSGSKNDDDEAGDGQSEADGAKDGKS